jgi:hypothetical protein
LESGRSNSVYDPACGEYLLNPVMIGAANLTSAFDPKLESAEQTLIVYHKCFTDYLFIV